MSSLSPRSQLSHRMHMHLYPLASSMLRAHAEEGEKWQWKEEDKSWREKERKRQHLLY
jgi:hypothetical protein